MKAKQAKRNRKVYFVPEYSRNGYSKEGWAAGIIVKPMPKGALIAYKDHTNKYNFNQLKYTPYKDLVLDNAYIATIPETMHQHARLEFERELIENMRKIIGAQAVIFKSYIAHHKKPQIIRV